MHVLIPFLTILLHASIGTSCHSFKDTNLTVLTDTGLRYHTVVNKCLERKIFNDTVVEISVENQKVLKLESDSVKHLIHLKVITFKNCEIGVVEVAVFRNVPRLKQVQIVNNNVKEVPKGTFSVLEQLQILDLSHNEIEKIETGAFGNSSTLKEVFLGFNNLEVFSPDWFDESTNLRRIDCQHNKIKLVPQQAFTSLKKINNICFDYNELETIHPEAFTGITNLNFLGLRHNKLKTIPSGTFPNKITIIKMRIDANLLNFLPKEVLSNLKVEEVALLGNPWMCQCLHEIHDWLFRGNGTVKDQESCKGRNIPVCSHSRTSTCTEAVDDELTGNYLGKLKLMTPPLDQYCARLDVIT